jgi:hypothetical protein
MRKIFSVSLAVVAGLALAGPSAGKRGVSPDEELAKILAGRAQGAPVSCVNSRLLEGNKGYGDSILFHTKNSRLVYLNQTDGCPAQRPSSAMRIRTTSTQFCRGDIVTFFDPSSGIEFGGCGLGDFTPYRKP